MMASHGNKIKFLDLQKMIENGEVLASKLSIEEMLLAQIKLNANRKQKNCYKKMLADIDDVSKSFFSEIDSYNQTCSSIQKAGDYQIQQFEFDYGISDKKDSQADKEEQEEITFTIGEDLCKREGIKNEEDKDDLLDDAKKIVEEHDFEPAASFISSTNKLDLSTQHPSSSTALPVGWTSTDAGFGTRTPNVASAYQMPSSQHSIPTQSMEDAINMVAMVFNRTTYASPPPPTPRNMYINNFNTMPGAMLNVYMSSEHNGSGVTMTTGGGGVGNHREEPENKKKKKYEATENDGNQLSTSELHVPTY